MEVRKHRIECSKGVVSTWGQKMKYIKCWKCGLKGHFGCMCSGGSGSRGCRPCGEYGGDGGWYFCAGKDCGHEGGTVWGGPVYTSDSSACQAARHAGVIRNSGGRFRITIQPGESSYRGRLRMGSQPNLTAPNITRATQ